MPTPRKAQKKCWCGESPVTLNGHCRIHGLPESDNTPRKATQTLLKVRPARFNGIEKYVIERVYEDRKDAEEIVHRVNMFEELVGALTKVLDETGRECYCATDYKCGRCLAKEALAKASQPGKGK